MFKKWSRRTKIIIAVGLVAIILGIGFLIYQRSNLNTSAAVLNAIPAPVATTSSGLCSKTAKINGTVKTNDGKPVVGATVTIYSAGGASSFACSDGFVFPLPAMGTAIPIYLYKTTTATGGFTVTTLPGTLPSFMVPSQYRQNYGVSVLKRNKAGTCVFYGYYDGLRDVRANGTYAVDIVGWWTLSNKTGFNKPNEPCPVDQQE